MKGAGAGVMALICWIAVMISASAVYQDAVKGPVASKAVSASAVNQEGDLVLVLTTDKKIYAPAEEIHISLEWINRGKKPLRILHDDVFVGVHMQCNSPDGTICPTRGGYNTWSPKAGVFTGTTVLLKPGQSFITKMDALVDEHHQLIFSNLFERQGSNGYQEFKKTLNLPAGFPDKYIAAGNIIILPGPGTYRFNYSYEANENDKHWRFARAKTSAEASVDLLWMGKIVSNSVEIQIR